MLAAAEEEAVIFFDVQHTKIDPRVDYDRRWLFKLSCVKSLLENYAGQPPNAQEADHRRHLVTQSWADFLRMSAEDFPYPPFLPGLIY